MGLVAALSHDGAPRLGGLSLCLQGLPDLVNALGLISGRPFLRRCLTCLTALSYLDVAPASLRVIAADEWGLLWMSVVAPRLAFPTPSSFLTSFSPGLNPIANFRTSVASRGLGAFEFMLSAVASSQGILRGGL